MHFFAFGVLYLVFMADLAIFSPHSSSVGVDILIRLFSTLTGFLHFLFFIPGSPAGSSSSSRRSCATCRSCAFVTVSSLLAGSLS